MLALTVGLLLATAANEVNCPALPVNRATPITVGRIVLDSSPTGATDAAGQLQFNGRRIIVRQPRDTLGLNITLERGTVGPVEVAETDATGRLVRQFVLNTLKLPKDSMNYQVVTARATTITFKSRNNEGAVLAICEIK